MKLPYKIEIRNVCDIIKECFGIEDTNREKRKIAQLEEIVIHKQPKREDRIYKESREK